MGALYANLCILLMLVTSIGRAPVSAYTNELYLPSGVISVADVPFSTYITGPSLSELSRFPGSYSFRGYQSFARIIGLIHVYLGAYPVLPQLW